MRQTDEASQSSSSSEDEDGDGILLTPNLDQKIATTIAKIRSRHPSVYDSSVAFFSEGESESENDTPKLAKKASKSVRQILAQQIIDESGDSEVRSRCIGAEESY